MMNYKLRDYQKQSSDAGVDFFRNGDQKYPAIIVIPTGGGKSLVIADIARRLKGNTIVFQPSKELLEQNYEKYTSYGNEAAIYSASMGQKEISKVTFATIGSVYKKPELFKNFNYCIVDECHRVSPQSTSMYQEFFENNKINIKLLGLTATPVRLKNYSFPEKHSKLCMLDRTKPRVFKQYIHVTQIEELLKRGYFSDIEYQNVEFDNSKLVINSTGGDYTSESMAFALKENDTLNKVKESVHYLLNHGRKHILIFVPTVSEAAYVARGQGEFVSGKTPKKERKEILDRFRSGKTKVVANVGVLTTGFDFPALDTIILARPTMSLGLHYQMIGRGVRPAEGKDKCVVYDFVGNYNKFGKIELLRIEPDENGMWGVYSDSGNLLTNRDIAKIGTPHRTKHIKNTGKIKFGKHKGKKFEDIPVDYMAWVRDNVERKPWTKEAIEWANENYPKKVLQIKKKALSL